ncbi:MULTISPECIES: GNAT family N-acetyltransferase [unclassified Duganella]|uniref:GNAT family N-acetyltransferase n=1 Tax=unclassified Duganella TaxID=2636909 RepID=UPI000AED76D5|nr:MULTISPECIES: GNAT family N-acetyltransferase [unclassified Duganella]
MKASPFPDLSMSMPLNLHFENLLASHLDELAGVLLHPAVYLHIEEKPPSLSEFKLGLERAIAGPGEDVKGELWLNYLVRDEAGSMLGRLEATVHHQLAEVAFLFGPQYWGRGHAATGLLWLHEELERGFAVTEFWATTTPENDRSQALLRRCGYIGSELPACPLYSFAPGDLIFQRSSN